MALVLCHAHPKITDIITDLGESINHTNHDAYTKTPIAISIETKGLAADQDEAILQLATWLSAHFSRLRALFMRQQSRAGGENNWDAAVEELCFLSAIMVFQHEWYLVAARTRGTRRATTEAEDEAQGATGQYSEHRGHLRGHVRCEEVGDVGRGHVLAVVSEVCTWRY
jgi:hypothetical protein